MILSEQERKDGGWITNLGSNPDDGYSMVDVITRDGIISSKESRFFDWDLEYNHPTPYDITHWRLHKPESNVESPLYKHPPVAENAPKSLEDAYDNPLSKSIEDMLAQMPTDPSYYKAPATKSLPEHPVKVLYLKKKSVEQMAVEIFNQITGNSLTEKNVKDIISLVAVINQIKGE